MNDDRLIVALDVPDAVSALNLTHKLGDAVSFYKIGRFYKNLRHPQACE